MALSRWFRDSVDIGSGNRASSFAVRRASKHGDRTYPARNPEMEPSTQPNPKGPSRASRRRTPLMTTRAERRSGGRPPTFSFYLTADACKKAPRVAHSAAGLADAITIAGPRGPEVVKRLREAGLEVPVLFDGMGYKEEKLPAPEVWVQQQARVGAARCLPPGVNVPWDKESDTASLTLSKSRVASQPIWGR